MEINLFLKNIFPHHALKPVDILKKGLAKLTASVRAHKDTLKAKLVKREPISLSEELWLDNEANIVDEECVLEALELALEYE